MKFEKLWVNEGGWERAVERSHSCALLLRRRQDLNIMFDTFKGFVAENTEIFVKEPMVSVVKDRLQDFIMRNIKMVNFNVNLITMAVTMIEIRITIGLRKQNTWGVDMEFIGNGINVPSKRVKRSFSTYYGDRSLRLERPSFMESSHFSSPTPESLRKFFGDTRSNWKKYLRLDKDSFLTWVKPEMAVGSVESTAALLRMAFGILNALHLRYSIGEVSQPRAAFQVLQSLENLVHREAMLNKYATYGDLPDDFKINVRRYGQDLVLNHGKTYIRLRGLADE